MQPGFTLAPRDVFADAKATLSSWDSCMAEDYCKWPVIVAIILGAIIVLSLVHCIIRCICCGAECAICCCRCCTCCSGSGHKRMDSYPPQPYQQPYYQQPYPQQPYPQQPYPQQPYPQQPYAEARSFAPPPPPPQIDVQYQSHATPTFNPAPTPTPAPAPAAERPQYATFDAHSKPVNEDALPAMPSWDTARNVRVEVEERAVPEQRGDVEMDRLNYNGSVPNTSTAGVAAGAVGAGMRASPGPGRSPISPVQGTDTYGFPAGYQNEYYRQGSPAQYQNTSPYGADGGYAQGNHRQPSPAPSYNQYGQAPNPQDSFYDRRSPAPNQPYDTAQPPYNPPSERYNSPAPPSYHTTANPYSYAPAQDPAYDQPTGNPPGYGAGGYGAVPSRVQSPSAYPGQQAYQAFQPQEQQYSGVTRRPVQGSLRDV